ncbi:MAG: TolC family protein [Hydrogenovibrio sp.]|uniref:TolC family protein n=1 Tax=Hydrogenovibrio sp. TaxID=2065821 RepID=UPI002870B1CD|nr:TolC family protein [Hydrogenovibrio sp.]MDR9499847.1 TolC family protein [Hydrogenovibrio sp.]
MHLIPPVRKTLLALTVSAFVSGCSVTPAPISNDESLKKAADSAETLQKETAPVTGAIDLSEAFARAVKHNREARLKSFEAVVQQRQIAVDEFDMLPELAAKAGYTRRSNYAASASVAFDGNDPDPVGSDPNYSVSSDKTSTNASIGATWDILDFGLSYFRAQQQADRFLIAKERERKVVHTLMQDVRYAYYRAVSSERLLGKINPLIEQAKAALADSEEIERRRARSPMDALTYQRELLETLRMLQDLRSELMPAKAELATLMGMNPATPFELADVDSPDFQSPDLELDVAAMERTALVKRPELKEAQYQNRITRKEVRSSFLQLFPSLSLNAGSYYNDSDYLKNNDWISAGVGLNWNLMNVFKYGQLEKLNDLKVAAGEQQALATAMSVISQVHIANIQFAESQQTFQLADQYFDVAQRIKQQVEIQRKTESAAELDLIREELNALLSELRRDVAYAGLQNSFGRIMSSMGLDPIPDNFGDMTLTQLAKAFDQRMRQWQQGQLPVVSQDAIKAAQKKAEGTQKAS